MVMSSSFVLGDFCKDSLGYEGFEEGSAFNLGLIESSTSVVSSVREMSSYIDSCLGSLIPLS